MSHDMNQSAPVELSSAIKRFSIITPTTPTAIEPALERIEDLPRPKALGASVYQIKAPSLDHSYFVTISNIHLNAGTDEEEIRPFEIFINTKDHVNLQWVNAFTLLLSAVFRKGGEYAFLLDELKEVIDPKGGWFGQHLDGRNGYINSLVSAIADAIEHHVRTTCTGQAPATPAMDDATRQMVETKKAEYLKRKMSEGAAEATHHEAIPGARDCTGCRAKASVIRLDGCDTCTACGSSKCQ